MKEADIPDYKRGAGDLRLLRITPAEEGSVREFFGELSQDAQACSLFHPHPFTPAEAVRVAFYSGPDYYAAVMRGGRMVGYGLLRGWEEGFEIPSLGIVVSSASRGLGLGLLLAEYLHVVARTRNAKSIILKVYKRNEAAVGLYRRLGYVLSELNDLEWRGVLDIRPEGYGADGAGRAGYQ